MNRPIICIPMGDPAGVGPEIAIRAVIDPSLRSVAKMLIVGNGAILKKASEIIKTPVHFNEIDANISNPDLIQDGACNFIECGQVDLSQFAYGKVSAMCGQAAFDCIKFSVDLANKGLVTALATTPINKESLKAAHIDFIGHTEILASLTNTNDPLTMFQVKTLRVFFLTRHMSLIKACESIKEDLVYRYIKRCTAALKRLGIKDPKIAIAGLNPHCGEHGLFGNEEDTEILPAIEKASAEGYKVYGPKPADSVFHFALQGAWDAVISLYHDQGHIATKMVDFDRTIALTHDMPFLRTSVDHGTAFDIAGTGKVSDVSMIEAIRLAALYGPVFLESKKG